MNSYVKFLMSLLTLMSVSFVTFAQEEDEEADDVEEVVVTGSRIARTSNYESVGPVEVITIDQVRDCLLYTSPSPRDGIGSRMPASA